MKSDIKNFPEFINSIKSDDLVYLFGTGISASLTGKSYSWWKWIIDGIHCMKDTSIASEYENSLKNDSSTANMIDIVGKVLKETKADGAYSSWMTTAFETNPITNFKLANTLKKLLITQDVIATTNYDLLLEQATGLSPLSYEEPNIAFSMLDCHVSTHILHIHGVYDSAHGKDNIVADEAQYNSVMENQGAQFIQGILGTRTLIFVGCGKTTEDANISRFIKFANEQLKMDCTYFFLYNSKNPVEGLPSNILPIPYGDEYADLSEFLEDMAQIRIKSKVESNPIIGRTAYQEKVTLSDPLLKYHYSQQSIPFCGRRKELSQLNEFVNSLEDFVWWSITGQAGAGKSRLALEFLKKLPVSWFGFFINDAATAKDIEDFVPFSHTVIVIDYVAGRERFVAELMRKMASKFATGHYRLRILLLERDNLRVSGSWYAILLQRFGKYDTIKTNEYKDSFLNLSDLDENAVDQFIGSVCVVSGLPDDRGRNSSLRKAYGQKFEQLQFRPLFVQLFVEAWIDNDFTLPRYDKFEDILENFLQREQERWLSTLDGDYATCNAFIHLLLRANITGKLNVKEIPDFYKEDWDVVSKYIARHSFPGKQRTQTQHTLINSICQNINESNEMIAPLFPDIIKEYMFCFYMEEERLPSMMNEIWRNAAHDFSVFITRCMTDFPENDFYKRAMNAYENSTNEIDVLNGRLELLKKWVINEDDDPYVLLDIISNEYEFWKSVIVPEDSSDKSDIIALLKVSGLNMVASQYGGWSLYDVSDMVAVAEEALAVKGGAATEFMKQFFLQQHITELSKAGFMDVAAYLRGKMEDLISNNPDEDWNSMLRMQNMNAEMMEYLLHDNIQSAYKTLKKMSEKCKYSCVETVRLLAHSCFNFDNFAFMLHQEKFLGRGLEIAQKVELLYPDDWIIRARILGCKGSVLQFRYFGPPSISKQELKEELIKLKVVLDTMSFINEESDEALGMTWGILNTLWINVVEGEQTELRMLIDKTDEILKINPYVEEVVTTKIIAIRALHKNILHTKVSHSEVEELFKYVELNFGSGSIRNEFFEMLSESEDADQRENYMTKWVMYGARQDAKYNPIMGSGIDEIDTEEEIYRYLFEFQPQEPYRREHRKIGANEPCPCGSGKKFKKCCRGKGIYD